MIEARASQATNLENTCRAIGNAHFAIDVLGAIHQASTPFYVLDTGSSIFPEQSNVEREVVTLPMSTLDHMMLNHPELRTPIFAKLDVQGAELEVLKGAAKTLERSEIVQLETALLPYNEGAPSAAEVISFMDKKGFAIFDIAGFIRQKDTHLIQIDLIFARKDSQLRPSFFNY
jgi:FkbM family methyltransferase